jgi:hypothetical protein
MHDRARHLRFGALTQNTHLYSPMSHLRPAESVDTQVLLISEYAACNARALHVSRTDGAREGGCHRAGFIADKASRVSRLRTRSRRVAINRRSPIPSPRPHANDKVVIVEPSADPYAPTFLPELLRLQP